MTLGLPLSTLWAFLLVLARVSGLVAFFPLPAFRAAPGMVRTVLAVAITLALFPVWPQLPNTLPTIAQIIGWAFSEAALGLAIGLAVAFLLEGFQVAMQIVGLQAGYGYSLTVDPTSQADSGVLQVIFMLATGWLFFIFGFDREIFRVLAASFERFPAGSLLKGGGPSAASLDGIVRLGSGMLVTGVRLALPVIALLLLIDLALALMGRMQQQLQLLSLAFPAKMLATLAILAALAPMFPRLFSTTAERTMTALWRLLS
ncbi:MAG: flagellar biosynthetic protein FliR [Acidobacteriota bacterium]